MGQITFVNPFPRTLVTGGIKTTYHHAKFLTELGFNAAIFQPDGAPSWCSEALQALNIGRISEAAEEILVFPEVLNGEIARLAQTPMAARKVMFCQNPFYMFSYDTSPESYAKLGFANFIAPGEVAKRLIETVLKIPNIYVVPVFIDPGLFSPRDKAMRIVTIPRKFPWLQGGIPAQANLLRTMLGVKYPHLRSVPWEMLENKSESEVADILGRSTIFLSLAYMEGCPLAPLEAMASGCIVIGYRGIGGAEYATSENGFWFSPEELESVTDTLASVIDGLSRGDQKLLNMLEAGRATAAAFNEERTKQALRGVYGEFAQSAFRGAGVADDPVKLSELALDYYRERRLTEALAAFDQLLALYPTSMEAHYNRANILEELQRPDEALAAYDQALDLKPNFVFALNNRGLILQKMQRYEEALASYDKALAIDPGYSAARTNREFLRARKQMEQDTAAPSHKE